jgi:ABC-2 type transport system permease protein
MAVYERNFGVYKGERTPERTRFLILPRYAYKEVFQSRWFVAFFALCFAVPFTGLLFIYLHHNLSALKTFAWLAQIRDALPIDGAFFRRGLEFQGRLAFLMALFVGPALVAPDLRSNGLALYLSRPFTRAEYVLGKMSVLAILLSLITWVPGMLLFVFQGFLEGAGWMGRNLGIAWGILAGSWAWILVLSLVSLAISAWVKWKPVARIAMLVIFLILSGFALAINQALDTQWGWMLSLSTAMNNVWASLFGQEIDPHLAMPVAAAWVTLAAGCLISLWLLSRRIRAYEVVR